MVSFLLSYTYSYKPCKNPMIVFECSDPSVNIYFGITLLTILFYFYIATLNIRKTKLDLRKLPPEFKFCAVMSIRQLILYIVRYMIKFYPHVVHRTLVYRLNLINIGIYYLCVLLYQLELTKVFDKVGMMYKNQIYYVFFILTILQVGFLGFFVIIYLTPINVKQQVIAKILSFIFKFNTYEYYIISGLAAVILSLIFIFSSAVASWLTPKFRRSMMVTIFFYCFIIILNCYDSFYYDSLWFQKNLLDENRNNVYQYINIFIKWVGELSVSFIQIIVVYLLSLPSYIEQDTTRTQDELFNEIDIVL